MKEYQITQLLDVGMNISVYISMEKVRGNLQEAEKLANSKFVATLKSESIEILSDKSTVTITSDMKHLYEFEICTKSLPQPIDVSSSLLTEEIDTLLLNDAYMTKYPDDYKTMSWTVEEVYQKMKNVYPGKDVFYLSSLAYSIKELENELTLAGMN